jgi:hypothetical protein
MVARYILCFLWGALLTNLWWGTAAVGIPPPNNGLTLIPVLAIIITLGTVIRVGKLLVDKAVKGD